MADIALITASQVSIVESVMQTTAPAGESVTPGAPVRFDASGNFVNGNASTTTENAIYGIATGKKVIVAGMPLTAVRIGVLDGFNFDDDAYGAPIFLSDTDARIADAAGTTVVVVGHIIPGTANVVGAARDKLLSVNVLDDLAYTVV